MYRFILLLLLPFFVHAQEDRPRPWRHEVTLISGFTRIDVPVFDYGCSHDWYSCTDWDGDKKTQLSTALTYHYLRPVGRFWLGAGGGLEGMGTGQGERFGLLTGIVEYRPGKQHLQTIGRLEAGVNVPIGSSKTNLADRKVGTILHPSVGFSLAVGQQRRQELLLTTGYRFIASTFSPADNDWGWAGTERRMTYRRLTCSLGLRF